MNIDTQDAKVILRVMRGAFANGLGSNEASAIYHRIAREIPVSEVTCILQPGQIILLDKNETIDCAGRIVRFE